MSGVTPIRRLAYAPLILAACLCAAPSLAQQGAMTIPRNLEQLTARASDIVRGTVVEAHAEKHPELTGLDTIVVTLLLKETLKGEARGRFTFRQYIWDPRDLYDAAGYRKGQDLLLLMVGPSAFGMSSPAGMGQGRFRIVRDRAGREMAVNMTGNVRLFEGLEGPGKPRAALSERQAELVAAHRGGPIAAGELTALIRAFAGNK